MKNRSYWILAILMISGLVQARPIFEGDFEELDIEPLFPQVNGIFQLPNGPATNQLDWVLQQLAQDDTSLGEINTHFDASWLSQITAEQTRDFIQSVRTDYPDAVVVDVLEVTPVSVNVIIQGQNASAFRAFLSLQARYSQGQKIVSFGVNFYAGTLQYPEDQNLTLTQAADKFATLAADTGLLIAYIDENNQCQPILNRDATTLRATGSIFKAWVLGGLAEAIDDNTLSLAQSVTLVDSERVFGGSLINREPNGTVFPLQDLGILMMGVSDNTATDLVHETVGRVLIDNYIGNSGVNEIDVLRPILSVNEQFHLFFSFDQSTALQYVNGSESFQQQFIQNSIVPLGPVSSFPFNNEALLTDGSWQASPLDICANMASLRQYEKASEARIMVDTAYGSQTAQSELRNHWDRVWYKGGSLVSAGAGYHVLTHGWLLEDNGRPPFVVVGMTNNNNGGIDANDGIFRVQSVLARLLELTAEL
ncbi:serine hydrolase [Marinicella sp. W31]|uniref:serine hydrolase n=1 Tax=Marinicella sp. W31 TaxID=3023713 RepID=UPI0037563542